MTKGRLFPGDNIQYVKSCVCVTELETQVATALTAAEYTHYTCRTHCIRRVPRFPGKEQVGTSFPLGKPGVGDMSKDDLENLPRNPHIQASKAVKFNKFEVVKLRGIVLYATYVRNVRVPPPAPTRGVRRGSREGFLRKRNKKPS
jgi:hypothetical protein